MKYFRDAHITKMTREFVNIWKVSGINNLAEFSRAVYQFNYFSIHLTHLRPMKTHTPQAFEPILTDRGLCWSFNADKVRDLFKSTPYITSLTENFVDDPELDAAAQKINR